MKTEHEITAKTRARIYLVMEPGAPGSVALALGGLIQVETLPSDAALGRLLRGFQWSVATSGDEPVCVVAAGPGNGPEVGAERRGFIRGVASALGMRVITVRSAEWQAGLGLAAATTEGDAERRGRRLLTEAQRRFPQLAVTPETAPALLLLAWMQSAAARAKASRRREEATPGAEFGNLPLERCAHGGHPS